MNFKMGWSVKLVAIGFLVAGTHSFAHAGGDGSLDCSTDSSASYCNQNAVSTGGADSLADLAGPQTVTPYTAPQNNPTTTDPNPSVSASNGSAASTPASVPDQTQQAGFTATGIQIFTTAATTALNNGATTTKATTSAMETVFQTQGTTPALQEVVNNDVQILNTEWDAVWDTFHSIVKALNPVFQLTINPNLGCSTLGQSVFGTPCSATQTQN